MAKQKYQKCGKIWNGWASRIFTRIMVVSYKRLNEEKINKKEIKNISKKEDF